MNDKRYNQRPMIMSTKDLLALDDNMFKDIYIKKEDIRVEGSMADIEKIWERAKKLSIYR